MLSNDLRRSLARWNSRLAAFGRQEDGNILVFGLFAFVMIIMVGGISVDMMRYESERVRLQGTADRAVLAAATVRDAPDAPTPEQILRSYFEAEGYGSLLDAPGAFRVSGPDNAREVVVTPTQMFQTQFMRLSKVDQLRMGVGAGASESVAQIQFEIVLVLDVSGSMRSNNRIENLRAAAIDFIETMLPEDNDGSVAITIVPYSTEVIMPAGTLTYFENLSDPSSGSLAGAFCIDFLDWETVTNSINTPMIRRNCATGDTFPFAPGEEYRSIVEMPIRPYLRSRSEAIAYIQSLAPSWGTSIDLGVRAGAMFLDPTLNPIIRHLIDDNAVSPVFSDRPLNWGGPRSFRALILMTDGENCCFRDGDPATRKPTVEIQDADTVNVCNALKNQNVTIYTVAFEAPPRGVALMEDCATEPSYFYNSSGAGLIEAFRSIARNIQTQTLRLTQ